MYYLYGYYGSVIDIFSAVLFFNGRSEKLENKSWVTRFFYIFCAVGIVASILTELEKVSPTVRAICGGDTGGCAQVGESEYSRLFGIPLGIWGLLSYAVWIVLYRTKQAWSLLFGSILMGAEFYFLFVMVSVLNTICPLCMLQFSAVLATNILLFSTVKPPAGTLNTNEKFRAAGIGIILVSFLAFFVPHKLSEGKIAVSVDTLTSLGDPSLKHRLEVFSDYECSHCKKYDETLKEVIANYPQIQIVFRDYIIGGHKLAPMAISYTGSVAYYQGKEMYLKARYETFDNQKNLFTYLRPRFEAIRDDEVMRNAVKDKLSADFKEAKRHGVRSTPTTVMIANGKIVGKFSGSKSMAQLKPELEKLLAE